jgi:hypothetical protein
LSGIDAEPYGNEIFSEAVLQVRQSEEVNVEMLARRVSKTIHTTVSPGLA